MYGRGLVSGSSLQLFNKYLWMSANDQALGNYQAEAGLEGHWAIDLPISMSVAKAR